MRAFTFALAQGVFPLLAFLAMRLALVGPARHQAFWQAASAPLRPRNEAVWLLAVLPIVVTMGATVATGARTASVWGLAIAAGLALLAASRARDAGATLSLPRLWRTLAVVWVAVAVLAPLWWQARAILGTPAVAEPREELAQALSRAWRAEFGTPLPWVSGTRALAASTSFYAADHPRYWSLWNNLIETPWADASEVHAHGAAIVCDNSDEACQGQQWQCKPEDVGRRPPRSEPRAMAEHEPQSDAAVRPHDQNQRGLPQRGLRIQVAEQMNVIVLNMRKRIHHARIDDMPPQHDRDREPERDLQRLGRRHPE